jgi:hypothetical protein
VVHRKKKRKPGEDADEHATRPTDDAAGRVVEHRPPPSGDEPYTKPVPQPQGS